jgi:hypothetical protein
MFTDKITDYFEGVAAKHLSAVDADPTRSNGHEIGGLSSAGATSWLGTPGKGEEQIIKYQAQQIYITDEMDEPLMHVSSVSWYDSRRNKSARSPEYRLYYEDSPVTLQFKPGDFFLIAKHRDGRLLMVLAPPKSSVEKQLRIIFGLSKIGEDFNAGDLTSSMLLLPLRLLLESLGFELSKPAADDGAWLDRLMAEFGDKKFPDTKRFSTFARKSLENEVDPLGFPDQSLMAWMEHEEKLFRIYESHFVMKRLAIGFSADSQGVEDFISYSLSVQNRRKSRVGHAFEGHIHTLFKKHALKFEQGAKGHVTENNARPDFLFPSFRAYHDKNFPTENLIMLGAKTTCKDRWRQVLSEAARIQSKHLITMQAAISEAQTNEMVDHRLQLVIPTPIHTTFNMDQRVQLLDVSGFIEIIKSSQ